MDPPPQSAVRDVEQSAEPAESKYSAEASTEDEKALGQTPERVEGNPPASDTALPEGGFWAWATVAGA